MPELTARNAHEWTAWLDEHHTSESEVWLVYYKKGTGKPSVAWAEAVEVALRFGWIDGLISTLDDERYKQRWTPRRARSKWSLVNKQICERLIAAGELRPMGLAAVEAAKASGEWDRAYTVQRPAPTPPDLREALKSNPEAKLRAQRISRTRHDRWMAWLDGTEGRTRTLRINRIVKALESRDYSAVDEAARKVR
ncbi:MAG: OmdA domain containing protein [Actinobacteria bacterium]|nr:OmdA domain containing protein [Actinomycetota bacterium]